MVKSSKSLGLERKDVEAACAALDIDVKPVGRGIGVDSEHVAAVVDWIQTPKEVRPVTVNVMGIHTARNPRFLFCKVEGREGKHPVVIPARVKAESLVGKKFVCQKIEDASGGVTYRHEWFIKHGYRG
jgi:hypothetical protein